MSSVQPCSSYDVGNLTFLSLRQFSIEYNNDEDEDGRMRTPSNAFLGVTVRINVVIWQTISNLTDNL